MQVQEKSVEIDSWMRVKSLIGRWFGVILGWGRIRDIQQSVISHLRLNKLLCELVI